MTKTTKTALLSVLLLCALIFSSCSGIVKMKYEEEYLLDSKNGIRYLKASVSYEPESSMQRLTELSFIPSLVPMLQNG